MIFLDTKFSPEKIIIKPKNPQFILIKTCILNKINYLKFKYVFFRHQIFF